MPPATPNATALYRAQWDAFERALPDLIARHRGKWAVWLDGLKGTFATEDEAFTWVQANVKPHSGVVVACVEPQEPVLLSAAWAFMPVR